MNRREFLRAAGVGAVSMALGRAVRAGAASPKRPNVVLVITDDQGYGEIGAHGNEVIKTPNLDRLHAQSVRFTAFHVSPTCSPTRASLMTGRHEFRSGVTHTILGRERLDPKATTVAQVLSKAGYATGIFGKWHLGDLAGAYAEGNAGARHVPRNRGFDEALVHGGGGIGQGFPRGGDYVKGNKYFDPTLCHNGKLVKMKGYCADIFFDAAMKWIEANRGKPFFAYITTNTPHSPRVCAESYSKPYVEAGLSDSAAAYYGMITNIDDNVGRLLRKLDDLKLAGDTLVIFMTDNGHAGGGGGRRKGAKVAKPAGLYNAGMKGAKGSTDEGGTRVPCFFRWPGTLAGGTDVAGLAGHIDIFPTLCELCGAEAPRGVKLDGRSLVPLLKDAKADWPDRYLFVHRGRWGNGQAEKSKYNGCAVRSQRFRLVNNTQLYDIIHDPGQTKNVIDEHPQVVAEMRAAYDRWWSEVLKTMVNE